MVMETDYERQQAEEDAKWAAMTDREYLALRMEIARSNSLMRRENERLKVVNVALLKAAKTALAIHDRYCDRVGAADSWAHDVRSQLEDAIALAETKP